MKHNITERSWVEIDLDSFRSNLRLLKSFLAPKQSFLQIVKADAYGHGAREIADIAIQEGAVYLGVANLEEGKLLRIQGINHPILILSPSLNSEIDGILEYDLVPSVSDLDFATALNAQAAAKGLIAKLHVKTDTGMHRSGILASQAQELMIGIKQFPNLEIEGLFSHFASAEQDDEFSTTQEKIFYELLENLPDRPKYIHLDNSAALVRGYGKATNLVRLGILSFGINTLKHHPISDQLLPVMTFKSTLSQIKSLSKGESVGYNRDWQAVEDTSYGIIPIGYADGYDFLLSNKGKVLCNGMICHVIGRISMDMITVELGSEHLHKVGDEVILLGGDNQALRAENIAVIYGGSPYELTCQIGRRARRFYYENAEFRHSSPISRRDFVSSDFSDTKLNEIIQSALAQRLQSEEIGELISREILRSFFYYKDKELHYRHNFVHDVSFLESSQPGYYTARTRLSYRKILNNSYFIIACAPTDEALRRYFMRPDVEYRWLLDDHLEIGADTFHVDSVRVNGMLLETEIKHKNSSLEIRCSHEFLADLLGQSVQFEIETSTLYPIAAHQFSVFISELTQGVDISFTYPQSLISVEPVTIFSGQDKNPVIHRDKNTIRVTTHDQEWVFPMSGVVFSY